MKLIDADKYLEKVCTYKETGCGSCKLQTTCPKDSATVKDFPPIEWIKKWQNDNKRLIEERMAMSVRLMLEAWEKENGRN